MLKLLKIFKNNRYYVYLAVFTLGFILLSSYMTTITKPARELEGIPHNYWVPTPADLAYQDSMYQIIQQTQLQLDTVKQGIDAILWKLERLEYSDGSWDSVRYKVGGKIDKHRNAKNFTIDTIEVIEEDGVRWYTLDTIEVSATMYYPVVGQCDDTPDITADQTKIPNIDSCSHLNWIAVSQDLLWFNDGPIRYGDTVHIIAGHKTGTYIVRDAMNKRFKFKIDFLESVGTDLYSFTSVQLVINS